MKTDPVYGLKLSAFARGLKESKSGTLRSKVREYYEQVIGGHKESKSGTLREKICEDPEQVINSHLGNLDLDFPEMVRNIHNAISPFKGKDSAEEAVLEQLARGALLMMMTQGTGPVVSQFSWGEFSAFVKGVKENGDVRQEIRENSQQFINQNLGNSNFSFSKMVQFVHDAIEPFNGDFKAEQAVLDQLARGALLMARYQKSSAPSSQEPEKQVHKPYRPPDDPKTHITLGQGVKASDYSH